MVFPIISYREDLEITSEMGDIEYLAIKEFDEKRVDIINNGLTLTNTTTQTDLVTQTASIGKDMYLAQGSFETTITSNGPFDLIARLVVNGVTVETLTFNESVGNVDNIETFKIKSMKVTTGQIIKITIQNGGTGSGNQTSVSNGQLMLWEEDTSVTPAV